MIKVEQIDGYEVCTEYVQGFYWRGNFGSGFSFPSDPQGNVELNKLKPIALEHYNKCIDGTYDVVKCNIEKFVTRRKLCECGSGEVPEQHLDARGIYLTHACTACEAEKLGRYRADVLTDCNYWTDEPIDEPD